MRTRLQPRSGIGLSAAKRAPLPVKHTPPKTGPSRLLAGLICSAVLTLNATLIPCLPDLQKGVLLSAKLMLALPPEESQTELTASLPEQPPVSETVSEETEPPEIPSEPSSSPSEEPVPESSEPQGYAPIQMPAVQPEPAIAEENKAALVHKTYTAAPSTIFVPLEKGFVKNCTHHSADEILAQAEKPPAFALSTGNEPQVLIMHTHTTESYFPFTGDHYDTTYPTRSTDNSINMAAVGAVIAERLTAAGIGVIHDTTQHDHPSYNGSYDRSAVTVKNYLEKYPSIKVVLDIHRDAIISGDTVTAPVVTENGQTAAQVMIISGCDNGKMNYPDYLKNFSFAAAFQQQMESDHPGFTRPILFDYRKYNQHLTTGSLLVEVGSHGNTLEQALLSGAWIGDSLGILLNDLRQ